MRQRRRSQGQYRSLARPSTSGRAGRGPSGLLERLEPRALLSASLVADVNTTPSHSIYPYITFPSPTPGVAYVTQHDGPHGVELWRTDGTPGGTWMVKDIFPGLGSSLPGSYANVGGLTYFAADDGATGYELWRTDGTDAGTWRVKDIRAGNAGSNPFNLTAAGDTLYFFADDGLAGRELWKSDGTEAGTTLVADLRPGPTGQTPNGIAALANGTAIFTASNGTQSGLFKTTGGAPTFIQPTAQLQAPKQLTSFGSRVYFTDQVGYVWATDGTNGGTAVVQNINSSVKSFATSGGALYFTRSNKPLYQVPSPGAAVVTVTTAASGALTDAYGLADVGGTLYFVGTTAATGAELFRVAAPSSVATLVKDFTAGAASTSILSVGAPQTGGTAFFVVGAYATGYTLWTTQGTPGSTQPVGAITPPTPLFNPGALVGVGPRVLFVNDDAYAGLELWASDGTSAAILNDYYPGTGDANPFAWGQLGNLFLFSANDGFHGTELWATDGSSAFMLADIAAGDTSSFPGSVTTFGGRAFFTASTSAAGQELYVTDGTPQGTHIVKDIRPGTNGSSPTGFTELNGIVYFFADNGTNGVELWRTDGTPQNTAMVTDIRPGSSSGAGGMLVAFNGALYFSGTDSVNGAQLWRSDGTAAGTALLKDLNAGTGRHADSTPTGFLAVGSALYFTATDLAAGNELWRTDGTPGGTSRVTNLNPGLNDSSPSNLTAVGGALYFVAADATGRAVWRADGSAAGATLLARATPKFLAALGDQLLYFTSTTAGQDLWRSDGTAAGTKLVRHIGDAALGNATAAAVLRGRLFFGANSGFTGTEIWSSDGTAAGTALTQEITPGTAEATLASRIVPFNDDLYFSASDTITGFELWRLTDTFAPYVAASSFAPGGPGGIAGTLNVRLSESLGAAPPPYAFVLTNLDTGVAYPSDAVEVTYDPAASPTVLSLKLRPAPETGAPDGNYRLTLLPGWIYDPAGNVMAADFTFDFFVLAGDANRDRTVNFPDLVAVAQNYDGVGKTLAEGDVNGDGKVDFADLVLVAQRYDYVLPPPPAAAPARAPSALVLPGGSAFAAAPAPKPDRRPLSPLFSVTPVAKPAAKRPKPPARPAHR